MQALQGLGWLRSYESPSGMSFRRNVNYEIINRHLALEEHSFADPSMKI